MSVPLAIVPPRPQQRVKARLDELLAELAADGVTRLPPEEELSRRLAVSRPTLRSALLALQKEGKVRRVHGRGTFINRHSVGLRANLAEDRPFLELLDRLGHRATTRTLAVEQVALDGDVAASLEVPAGTPGIAVERLFEADGAPAVLSIDRVPRALLTEAPGELGPESSTFELVREHTRERIRYSVAELVPVLGDAHTAEVLAVARDHPLLLLRHVHIGEREQPLAVTTAFVNDRYLRFSVVRAYVDP